MRTPRSAYPRSDRHLPLVLQTALTFLAPSIILRFVGNFILPESWWWLLVFGVLYLVNGYTGGRLYLTSIYHNMKVRQADTTVIQTGAGAGVLLFILGWIGYTILVVLVKLFFPIILAVESEPQLVCMGLLEFFVALGLGAVGARLYR